MNEGAKYSPDAERIDNKNPADGSNWELLCLYCHDNEHQRQLEAAGSDSGVCTGGTAATHSPFVNLKAMLGKPD